MKLTIAVAALSLLVALGCSKKGGGGSSRVPVTIARAEQRPVPYELFGTGTVEPRQTASVQAQVTGILTRVAFHEGDEVAAGRLLVREGNLVRSNAADPLVVINQIRPILVRFAVPQEHLGDIQRYRQHRLPVFASPSQSDTLFSEGVLTFVDNSVDTTTGTVLLKGEFSNLDNALWPGEFLNVRLQLYIDDKALVVPAQAVMTGQQGTYVFVLNQDGTARSQPVTVERPAGAYAVIAQGVRPGDEVVTDGQVRLVNGAPVEVKGSADPARAMEGDK